MLQIDALPDETPDQVSVPSFVLITEAKQRSVADITQCALRLFTA